MPTERQLDIIIESEIEFKPEALQNCLPEFGVSWGYVKNKIGEALHQIHEGKDGNAIQILNHLLDQLT